MTEQTQDAHLSRADIEDRLKKGQARRKDVPRSKLAQVHRRSNASPSIGIVLSATEGRVPSLLQIKYSRMSQNAFAFFRGAVSIMAADFSNEPNTGLTVQLCGDAHVQNLGCFEAPDGRLVFDINDFDETTPGPWEWDVKRMATSIILAGEQSAHGRSACQQAAETFVTSYCVTIETLAGTPVLDAARHQIHRIQRSGPVAAAWQQAVRATADDLLKKYTETAVRKNAVRFREIPQQLWRIHGKERTDVLDSLALYRQSLAPERVHLFDFFRPLDVAFKVVGTGSVGLRDYIVLMEGNGPGDPLFLQIKQEVASAYAPFLHAAPPANQGERVVIGQRRIQPASDLLLGYTRIGEHDYLVRQMSDHKAGINLNKLRGPALGSLAEIAGELLARGHARSGDAIAIKGYIGAPEKVIRAIVNYATNYSRLMHSDFEAFTKAINEGKVKAAAGSR